MAVLTEHAFGEFYRRSARPLWVYVYRVTGSAADADDIVQEAFLRLLKTELPDATDEAWRRYLFRIAGNLIADRWRRSAREDAYHAREREPDPPRDSRESQDDEVSRTFAALKARDRALLWLAYVEEENHQQIADTLGLARGSVKVLLSRARARLRDLLVSRGLNARS